MTATRLAVNVRFGTLRIQVKGRGMSDKCHEQTSPLGMTEALTQTWY